MVSNSFQDWRENQHTDLKLLNLDLFVRKYRKRQIFCWILKGGLNEKEHRVFWVFRNRFKNVKFGFFGVEKFIKIFVSAIFKSTRDRFFNFFFDVNLFVEHQLRVHWGSQNSEVKRGHLRSNLKFRPKNSFTMTHIDLSHENVSISVIWSNKNNAVIKFYLGSFGVKWSHFYENRLFQLFSDF